MTTLEILKKHKIDPFKIKKNWFRNHYVIRLGKGAGQWLFKISYDFYEKSPNKLPLFEGEWYGPFTEKSADYYEWDGNTQLLIIRQDTALSPAQEKLMTDLETGII